MSETNSRYKGGLQNRHFPRMDLEVLLAYRPLTAPDEEPQITKSKTMGLGGLMFEADHPLQVGSTYLLDLVLGEDHMEVESMVVYSLRLADDLHQNGFNFIGITETQRESLTTFFIREYEKNKPEVI